MNNIIKLKFKDPPKFTPPKFTPPPKGDDFSYETKILHILAKEYGWDYETVFKKTPWDIVLEQVRYIEKEKYSVEREDLNRFLSLEEAAEYRNLLRQNPEPEENKDQT